METPPPLPAQTKSGSGAGKVVLIVFATFGVFAALAFVGLFILGIMEGSASVRSVGFTPADIEARCRASGLDYHALARDSRLEGRASELQREQLESKGIKIYRAKIRKKSDVVFIISIIESPREFTSSQVKEILDILVPATPVAVHGRFIYCNAGRPDPKGSGDDVIWMNPQDLFDAL